MNSAPQLGWDLPKNQLEKPHYAGVNLYQDQNKPQYGQQYQQTGQQYKANDMQAPTQYEQEFGDTAAAAAAQNMEGYEPQIPIESQTVYPDLNGLVRGIKTYSKRKHLVDLLRSL